MNYNVKLACSKYNNIPNIFRSNYLPKEYNVNTMDKFVVKQNPKGSGTGSGNREDPYFLDESSDEQQNKVKVKGNRGEMWGDTFAPTISPFCFWD